MISHENYEKRSLNMEFKYGENVLYNITLALADDRVKCIVHSPTNTLMLVKDSMNGAPCWRRPNKKELKTFEENKKHEI